MEQCVIHYTLENGTEDEVYLEGETIGDIRQQTYEHLDCVGGIET